MNNGNTVLVFYFFLPNNNDIIFLYLSESFLLLLLRCHILVVARDMHYSVVIIKAVEKEHQIIPHVFLSHNKAREKCGKLFPNKRFKM